MIPMGPAASQIAIKQLGTNGGGFFGVNSAHPFENPTALTSFLELVAILLIPAALTYTYGKITGNLQHGWCLLSAMAVLFLTGLTIALWAEHQPNNALALVSNLEGKELRFGVTGSVLWSVATTAASNGSVNAMHASMAPLAGLVQMFNIMLGEVIFGGVGAGLYGMLMFVLLTVFIAGLMVGRTPEYLGKKIEQREVVWAVIAVILPSAMILCGTALSCLLPDALASRANTGPHGFSEMLYAWTSASGNNGSAFAGLNANTNFYNIGLALAMLVGRFGVIIPALAIAGSMAAKKTAPPSPGTFPTDGVTFVALLIGVIVIVGGLTFLPALTLGPVLNIFSCYKAVCRKSGRFTMAPKTKALSGFSRELVGHAVLDSVRKLHPREQWKNLVIFVVYLGAIITTINLFWIFTVFSLQVVLWLWFTVLFANFAESVAEGREKLKRMHCVK